MTSPDSHTILGTFEALAESAPDAILTIDERSIILSANPATERIFGYAPAELVGQPLTVLMPERLRTAHERGIARYLGSRNRTIPWTGIELPGLHRDGHEFPVEISFGEFVDETGRHVFSGFVRDVSERARQQAELQRAREDAEAALKVRDDVLSIVSHDLRNPVSTIAMSASLLADDAVHLTPEQRRTQIEVISRSAQRMNRMIQDLLDVARIEGGHFNISRRCEPSGALAHEACAAFQPIARTKGIEIDCVVETGLPPVFADRDRVVQLLSNYLNNALKFSRQGDRVVLAAQSTPAGGVVYSVSDAGPGIQEADLAHLFNRFWQAKRTAHLGTGLGLAIALGIAQAHGGRVWAESTPGVKTTFYFQLPRAPECG